MANHPRRNKLAAYGGRIINTDGRKTVELRYPNDRRRFQFRRVGSRIERRVLTADGKPFIDTGSPWELMSVNEIAQLHQQRGEYHPILDPLGITSEDVIHEALISMSRRA